MALNLPDFGFAQYKLADAALAVGYLPLFGGSGTAMSVACWFRPATTPGGFQSLLGSTTGGSWSTGCGLWFWAGTVRGWVGNYATHSITGPTVDAKRWTHVCLTYDGATVALYTNGVLSGTVARTGTVTHGEFTVGRNHSDNMVGAVDTVGVWSVALSATQVRTLYQARATWAGLPASVKPGIRHFWNTDQQRHVYPAAGSEILHAVSPTAWPGGGIGPQPAGCVRRGGTTTRDRIAAALVAGVFDPPAGGIPELSGGFQTLGL